MSQGLKHLVIIGTGWGGFPITQSISLHKYAVTVISPMRTIQYTPLLASAACGLFDFRLAEEPVTPLIYVAACINARTVVLVQGHILECDILEPRHDAGAANAVYFR